LFHVLRVAKRESIFASFNRALALVETPYVAWLAADDMRPPDSLAREVATLEQNKDVDITYGDYLEVQAQGASSGTLMVRPEMERQDFLTRNRIAPSVLCRMSLIRRIGGFDEQYLYRSDGEFQMRAVFAGARFKKTEGILYYHTSHAARGPHPTRRGDVGIRRRHDIEGVVTRLRYGQYHLPGLGPRAYRYVNAARRYRLDQLLIRGEWRAIDDFVPNYRDEMSRLASRRVSFERTLPLRVLWERVKDVPRPAVSAARQVARSSLGAIGLLPAAKRVSMRVRKVRDKLPRGADAEAR
jgi:hypothetical protein